MTDKCLSNKGLTPLLPKSSNPAPLEARAKGAAAISGVLPLTGFTLIEILVVIAVIGVLASVILASFSDARKKGRDLQRVSAVKELQKALELYYDSQNYQYPPDLATLAGPTSCGNSYCIVSIPKDPVGAAAYPYFVCGDSYHLGAGLENSGNTVLGADRDLAPMCAGDSIDGRLEDGTASAACQAGSGRSCYDVSSLQ